MTTINLGQDWEMVADAPNNRLLVEYTPNGSRFELNEDGTLKPLDGGIETDMLNGADLANSANDTVLVSNGDGTYSAATATSSSIDLSDLVSAIAGDNLTADTTNGELDSTAGATTNKETGHVNTGNVPDGGSTVETVTLSNTYKAGTPSCYVYENNTPSSSAISGDVSDFITDGDGNITGFDVTIRDNESSGGVYADIDWVFAGIQA